MQKNLLMKSNIYLWLGKKKKKKKTSPESRERTECTERTYLSTIKAIWKTHNYVILNHKKLKASCLRWGISTLSLLLFNLVFEDFSSVRSLVMSESLHPSSAANWASCPSPTLGAYWSLCSLSQWCHPAIPSSSPASIFPRIRVFSNESVLRIRWPEY